MSEVLRRDTDADSLLGLEPGSRRRGLRRRLAQLAGVVLALALAGWLFALSRTTSAATGYVTEPAARGALNVVVTATGSVQPTSQVEISSELSGTVRRVFVDYNSRVEAGQVLAELDTDRFRAAADSARARLDAARAHVVEATVTLEEKERDYQRKRALASTSSGSRQDLDAAKAAFDRAAAALASARADVGTALADVTLNDSNLAKTRIVSPINGLVLKRNVDPGQTVASSFQTPVLFTIAEDLRQMEVQVDVDEADVGKVHEGQHATFSVDAYPDRRFPARIRELRFASETVQGVVTYKAVLTVDNAELLLRPGMTATAEIVVQEIAEALLVPNAALRFTPPAQADGRTGGSLLSRLLPGPPRFRPASRPDTAGPTRTVWVLRGEEAVAVPVVAGATDGRRTEIREGSLAPGDAVITDVTSPTRG
ncbi:efflux RND transporter periplasmic adaptor subunit [Arenibaculum pallidiluteum]|uniref:efflux RND transporter periplasmic adaptor subunit n=1 Tax=Arenibaculum pallidiluteum TaxID=2812559 RepID=UPI001A96C910|nr:efflux RND transporter periplasmic adaptor subunit [Arenibaculum pallidiluteum]